MDVLWHCLVCDSDSSDDTLEWFLQQAQSKEFHALDVSALQYIFAEKVQNSRLCHQAADCLINKLTFYLCLRINSL